MTVDTMKQLVVFTVILLYVHLGTSEFDFISKLPAGEYRVKIKSILNCNPKKDNDIQVNLYPSQKAGYTDLKGNITSKILFDDSLFFETIMSIKDKNGVWKENVFVHKAPKACTTVKNFFGSQWITVMNTLGIKNMTNANCMIPPGTYNLIPGEISTSILSKTNLPKTFFYGTYKMRTFFTLRHKDTFGCSIFIIDVERS